MYMYLVRIITCPCDYFVLLYRTKDVVVYLSIYPGQGLVLGLRRVSDVVGHVPQVDHHGAHLKITILLGDNQ